ncbi:MAG: sigma-70 family RNA polymerase sigma factor [Chitinophagaceae bacterium]
MDNSFALAMSENKSSSVTQVVKRYGNQLLHFIKGKVGSLHDAEDILQDVWMQLSRLTNIAELESVSGWLYYVAKNKITDRYRKRQPDRLEDFTYGTEDGDWQIREILLLDESEDPELKLFKDIFWKTLMQALDELPENQRLVFVQNEIEDMTLQEIANEQNENLKTIISRKGYAIKHIRKKLQYLYDELNT